MRDRELVVEPTLSDRAAESDLSASPILYRARLEDPWRTSYVAPTICRLTGYPRSVWMSHPDLWIDRVHPDDRGTLQAARRSVARGQGSMEIVYRLRDRSGQQRTIRDQAAAIGADADTCHGAMLDVTSRPRQRHRTSGRWEHLRALIHDIRSPLTATAGIIQTLLRGDMELSDTQVRELLLAADRSLEKVNEIASSALSLDALRSQIAGSETEMLDLVELARQALDRDEGIAAELVVEERDLTVRGHREMLQRALTCLVDNAFSHTPLGTSVRMTLTTWGEAASVVVDDDGPGVPDEVKGAIFEPFERGWAPASRGGLGLGLAIVQLIAEAHAGAAWVQDAPGGGASFRLLLPRESRTGRRSGTCTDEG